MRLQEFWGVGPKTAAQLTSTIGEEAAVEAIESGDVRTLTDAGLDRGRVTRILRRAAGDGHGEAGMEVLATRDSRAVYKDLLALASEYAVTERAADRITIRTPLRSREKIEERLDRVEEAVASWQSLSDADRRAVIETFDRYDSLAGDRAAVTAAIELHKTGVEDGIFAPVAALDVATLEAAVDAMGKLDGDAVADGADAELARLRSQQAAVDQLAGSALDVLEQVRGEGVRDEAALRDAVCQYVARETEVDIDAVRRAAPDDAADAADYVGTTLRQLATELHQDVDEREETVRNAVRKTLTETETAVEAAVVAIDDVATAVSLARFAIDRALVRPTISAEEDALAIEGARNLQLATEAGDVQPIDYAVGEHELDPPTGEQVAVLTGANSGGKTTLLETACQVALLGSMGLPVPAERATISPFDSVVFHRRHASFNAGVLESTLQSVVPPLTAPGRTLMLVDEFEAITEPGSAAAMLHGLVNLVVDEDAIGVFVTHLAGELEPLPAAARLDGIFAEGLDADLELVVDYQPRFHTLGRSTPEFIVTRLVSNAADPHERVGFEALADRLGAPVLQRRLDDDWT